MNTFIINLDNLTLQDLEAATEIDKTDKLFILTSPDGSIPVTYYPYLTSLKVKPEFIAMQITTQSMGYAFILGLLCANCTDKLYIITDSKSDMSALDGATFDVPKGKLTIVVTNNIKNALKHSSKKREPKSSTQRKPRTPKVKKEDTSSETTSYMIPDEELMKTFANKRTASAAFIEILEALDNNELKLVERADILAECVAQATDPFMTLELQIQLRLGKETALLLAPILGQKYHELRNTIAE